MDDTDNDEELNKVKFTWQFAKTKNKIYNVSEELNQVFGTHGTESRKEAERQAWEEYNVQILLDARKQSGNTIGIS